MIFICYIIVVTTHVSLTLLIINYYLQAGELSKALELCFQYRQYDALQVIAEDLSEGSSPEIVRKVAEYFVQQEQFDKAVDILLRSNKV